MLRLPLLVLLASLAACQDDPIVDPSTGDTTAAEAATDAPTSTTAPTDPFTGAPSTFTTGDPPDPTTGDPTDTDGTTGDVPLCEASEPVTEAEFVNKMTARVCVRRGECGCAGPTCVVDVAAGLSDMTGWAGAQGLVFDADCAARMYARSEVMACADQLSVNAEGCAPCLVYRGAVALGQPCVVNAYILYAGQCADGLACNPFTETCQPIAPPPVGPGETCFEGQVLVGTCPAGTTCDPVETGKCRPTPAVGEPCIAAAVCDTGQFCDVDTTCQPRRPVGSACTSPLECETLECTQDLCTATPWICEISWGAGG